LDDDDLDNATPKIKISNSFKDEEIYQKRRRNTIIIDSESDEDCIQKVGRSDTDSIDTKLEDQLSRKKSSNFNQVSIKKENIEV